MNTLVKIIAGISLAVLLLLAAAAVYLKFFFDPNDLRDRLAQQVESRTGRELVMEGDFSLSVFPWFAVNAGRTRLSDDAAFGTEPLVSFDSASASIKLRPLFRKQIELGTTSVKGLDLSLIRKADGSSNWEAFMATLSKGEADAKDAAADSAGFATRTLGAVELVDANIRFTDETVNDTLVVSKLNLITGELVPGQPFDVNLSTLMNASNVALEVKLDGRMQTSDGQLDIEALDASVSGNHHLVPFASFAIAVTGSSAKIRETMAMLEAPQIEWQMSGGREAAEQVQTLTGKLTADRISLDGEDLMLERLALDLDSALDGKPLKTFTADLKAAAISRNGKDMQISSPELNFDSAMNDETLSAVNGAFSGGNIIVRNDTELTMPSPKFDGVFKGPGVPDGSQAVKMSAEQFTVDIDKGALQLAAMDFAGAGLKVSGVVDVTSLYDTPVVRAPLRIAQFNLRELLPKLGMELETSDPAVLSKVAGTATVRMDGAGYHLDRLNAKLDESTLTGNISVGTKGPTMTLAIDAINMDRYLPPPDQDAAAGREVDAVEIPAQTLRELNLNGDFKVGKLTFGGIESQNVVVKVASDKGNVRVYPARAELYGGTYSGDVRIDASGEVPAMSLNERFDNVDFGALSKDIAGTDRISGRITGALTMTASGHNTSDLKATSNGTTSFTITNGVLEGVNIMEAVRNIVALANKEALKPDEPDRTEFRKLAGTAVINNGVLNNNDLTIEIPLLRVTGSGSVNLNNKAISYKIGTRVVQEGDVPLEKELQFLSDYTLPVFISGTYDAPLIDKGASVADLVKQYAKKRVTDKIFDRLGLPGKKPAATDPGTTPAEQEPAATVEDVVKDRLKDLLGGRKTPAPTKDESTAEPTAEPEEAPPPEEKKPESPEDAVKKALKDLLGDGN